MVCYSCHEPVGAPVCVGCGALQPPPVAADPFAVLGMERKFHIDESAIERKYLGVARVVHPDRFVKKSAVEKRMALQWTALLNESRRIIKDPMVRARFLATGQAAPKELGGPKLDPEFLAEMFDWRERDEDQPGVMRELAAERRTGILEEIDAMFTAWEAGNGQLDLVDDRLSRLKYVDGLLRESEA